MCERTASSYLKYRYFQIEHQNNVTWYCYMYVLTSEPSLLCGGYHDSGEMEGCQHQL